MTLVQGSKLGPYEILESIGSGGMGEVWKAKDTRLGRIVAIKKVKEQHSERFKQEARSIAALNHPNICQIFDIGDDYLVLEYVEGKPLSSPQPEREAVRLAIQIASALEEAQQRGIIHRDLKPSNIMVTDKGSVKLLDFGLAKLYEQDASISSLSTADFPATQAGAILGTAAYMSPEQAQGKPADARSDIFSFGLVLYEMLSGRRAFSGDSNYAVMDAIVKKDPSPLQTSPPLERIVKRCLQKNPSERYQTMSEAKAALEMISEERASKRTTEPHPSIAVLPFADMSPGKDNEWFSDGLAEEIINALTQMPKLKVIARTSAFAFKGKEQDIRRIAEALNVSSILEGSVRKAGDRIRVTAQLVNASDGSHLWSERYDRDLTDVFAIQDEISMAVVDKLKVELLEGERERLTRRHTQNKEAYQLYLKGRYHWNRRYPKDMIQAVDYFQRAFDKDPEYALPLGGIADVFNMLAEFGFISPQEAYLKSKALLQKALEIDDSLSEIYSSLALITYCYEWDLPAAERYAIRSIKLNPQNMFAHSTYGEILGTWGRFEEALEEAKRAVESEPLSSLAHAFFAVILAVIGRVEESREQFLRAEAMEPDQPMICFLLGLIYLAKPASPEKAIRYLQKAADIGVTASYGYLGMAKAMVGQKEEALKYLAKLEQVEKERFLALPLKLLLYMKPGLRHFRSFKKKYCPAYLKAFIYLGLNRQEEALTQLEKSGQARDYLIPALLKVIEIYDLPCIKEVTSSPRFKSLKAKIKTSHG